MAICKVPGVLTRSRCRRSPVSNSTAFFIARHEVRCGGGASFLPQFTVVVTDRRYTCFPRLRWMSKLLHALFVVLPPAPLAHLECRFLGGGGAESLSKIPSFVFAKKMV
ncbi:hypothetical protein TNIN_391751 [Trichonephila inaurata madagascariensis]|uniref:Uncharacterized protein n=1 Tax=Trichonephila inaurata madagascariensis TaxID=2747483 RepID=A0A8X6XBZ4_9ARAC|nr:hypothetical protein TNIN_391751 [Trichonephila inaurata madagascariensis]